MAANSNKIQLALEIDGKGGVKVLRQVGDETTKAGKKGEKSFKKLDKSAKKTTKSVKSMRGTIIKLGVAAGGLLGLRAAYTNLTESAQEWIELAEIQEEAETRLQSVLEATGYAAGYNFDQLAAMASGLQQVTKVGDEVTIGGMAILATFKQVRGEAFERTTAAALDMATVMGKGDVSAGNLESTMVQLGKALNDPIANLSALSRAGVQFTDDQKEMIKTLWESGDVLGAQTIILEELESQFGGAAKAARENFRGGLTAAQNALGDTKEELGFVITKNQFFIELLHLAEKQFISWGKYIRENRGYLQDLVRNGVIGAIDTVTMLVSAVRSLGSVVVVGGALYAGLAALPVVLSAMSTAYVALNTKMAAFLTLARTSGPLAAMNTTLWGTSAAATAASGAMGALKVAAGTLFAAYAGWKLGSWLYDNFETARLAGLAFVDTMVAGWIWLQLVAKNTWTGISSLWDTTIGGIKEKFADFLWASARKLDKAKFFPADLIKGLQEYSANIDVATEGGQKFEANLADISNEFDRQMLLHRRTIDSMLEDEFAKHGTITSLNAARVQNEQLTQQQIALAIEAVRQKVLQKENEKADVAKRATASAKQAYDQLYSDLGASADGYYEFEKAKLQAQHANFVKTTGDRHLADQWLTAEMKNLSNDRMSHEWTNQDRIAQAIETVRNRMLWQEQEKTDVVRFSTYDRATAEEQAQQRIDAALQWVARRAFLIEADRTGAVEESTWMRQRAEEHSARGIMAVMEEIRQKSLQLSMDQVDAYQQAVGAEWAIVSEHYSRIGQAAMDRNAVETMASRARREQTEADRWRELEVWLAVTEQEVDAQYSAYDRMKWAWGDFKGGLTEGYKELQEHQLTFTQAGTALFQTFATSSANALSSSLFSVMKGDFDNVGAAWQGMLDSMLKAVADTVAQMAVQWAITKGWGLLSGLLGLPTIHTGAWEIKPDELPAILQQGEMVVDRGRSEAIRSVFGSEENFHGFIDSLGAIGGAAAGSDFSHPSLQAGFEAMKGNLSMRAMGLGGLVASGTISAGDLMNSLFSPSALMSMGMSFASGAIKSELGIPQNLASRIGGIIGSLLGSLALGPLGAFAGNIIGSGLPDWIGDITNSRDSEELLDELEDMYGRRRAKELVSSALPYGGDWKSLYENNPHLQAMMNDAEANMRSNIPADSEINVNAIGEIADAGYGGEGEYGGTAGEAPDQADRASGDVGREYHSGGILNLRDDEGYFIGQKGEEVTNRENVELLREVVAIAAGADRSGGGRIVEHHYHFDSLLQVDSGAMVMMGDNAKEEMVEWLDEGLEKLHARIH